MKNLSPDICRQIGQARREQGISQSALAVELGCKQPALSMFEAGDGTKLSEEAVKKLAKKFNVSLDAHSDKTGVAGEAGSVSAGALFSGAAEHEGFCPNCHCPSNFPYLVDGRLLLRPSMKIAAPVSGAKRCAVCGEVLEKCCPTCGAPLNDGACCAICGMPYVTPTLPSGTDPARWIRARREEIEAFRR